MVNLFISYAHSDEAYKQELEKHLAGFTRKGIINKWSDREIEAGADWEEATREKLETAQIILFLISADFISSDYILDVELKRALDRYRKGELIIVPIILRPTDYSSLEISRFQALPTDGRPISTWDNQDEAWMDVVNQLAEILESIHSGDLNLKESSSAPVSDKPNKSDFSTTIKKIKKNLVNNNTEKAIEDLADLANERDDQDLYSQAILLASRYNRLKKSEINGIISPNDANLSRNQITHSLLSILQEFE